MAMTELCCLINGEVLCEECPGEPERLLCYDHVVMYKYPAETLSGRRTWTAIVCKDCFEKVNGQDKIGTIVRINAEEL